MIFITGAAGWIGLNLLEELIKDEKNRWGFNGKPIHALLLPGSEKRKVLGISSEINIVEGDLTSKSHIRNFLSEAQGGTIIHTAGIIHPKRAQEFYNSNVSATRNLLEVSKEYGVRKIVLLSSNSPFGFNKTNKDLFTEKTPYNPYMGYGKSKMLMEKMAISFIEKSGLDITIIRAPWFYGPHQPERQKRFFEMIKNGKVPIIGNGGNVRSMVFTKNLCQGLLLAATKKIARGKIYWIADNDPYDMNMVVDTIEDLLATKFYQNCRKTRIKLPNAISSFAQICDYMIQKIGLYNQEIHVLSEMNKNIACSIDLAKKELRYNPTISLREGMEQSLKEIYYFD